MAKSYEKLTDKTVRKYFNKIVNRNTKKEKEDLINNLKKLISNPKTPLRNKIAQAIELAENVKTK